MSNLVIKPAVRIAWPNLTEPRAFQPGAKKWYDIKLLIPKEEKDLINRIRDFAKKAVDNATNLKATQKKEAIANSLTAKKGKLVLLKDGDIIAFDEDENGKKFVKYPEYQGHFVMTVKAYGETKSGELKDPPPVYDKKVKGEKEKLIDPAFLESSIYGGCWCFFSLYPSVYNSGGDCGVSLRINQIMKYKDDEPFVKSDFDSDDFASPDIPEADDSYNDETEVY